jgi:hypothetical protein
MRVKRYTAVVPDDTNNILVDGFVVGNVLMIDDS